jgi:hypothetical protein
MRRISIETIEPGNAPFDLEAESDGAEIFVDRIGDLAHFGIVQECFGDTITSRNVVEAIAAIADSCARSKPVIASPDFQNSASR